MTSIFFASVCVISVFSILLSIYVHKPEYPPLEVDQDDYWRSDDPTQDDDRIYPFTIDIPDTKISEFKSKLKTERFYNNRKNDATYDSYFKNLSNVILDFDWKSHQNFLNTFKQYKTQIEGLDIHFLRISTEPVSKKVRVVPLLMVHGFPGSFWDFYKIIPILSNPTRHGFDFGVNEVIQFDVIVPSLPGFLFSEKPEKLNFTPISIARILGKLMKRLDVNDGYFVHGSEGFGADIATVIASLYPERVMGLQLSNPFVRPTFSTLTLARYLWRGFRDRDNAENSLPMTDISQYFSDDKFSYAQNADTYATAFFNSPAGAIKYMESQWRQLSSFSSTKNLHQLFTLDEIATEIYLYWLTDSLPSALIFLANSYDSQSPWHHAQVRIPTGISYSLDAPWRCHRTILDDKYLNITRLVELPKGGMFHHLQDGHSIAKEIFEFVEIQLL